MISWYQCNELGTTVAKKKGRENKTTTYQLKNCFFSTTFERSQWRHSSVSKSVTIITTITRVIFPWLWSVWRWILKQRWWWLIHHHHYHHRYLFHHPTTSTSSSHCLTTAAVQYCTTTRKKSFTIVRFVQQQRQQQQTRQSKCAMMQCTLTGEGRSWWTVQTGVQKVGGV